MTIHTITPDSLNQAAHHSLVNAVVPEPSQYGFFVVLAVVCFIAWRRFTRKAA